VNGCFKSIYNSFTTFYLDQSVTSKWHHYRVHQVYRVYGDIHLGWVGDLLEMKFMFGLNAEAIMGKIILFRSSNQAKAQRSLKSVVSG